MSASFCQTSNGGMLKKYFVGSKKVVLYFSITFFSILVTLVAEIGSKDFGF